MAAPRWERNTVRYPMPYGAVPKAPPERPGEAPPGRRRSPGGSRKETLRRRRLALLVVVPVLMMLGSVYLHTVAAGLGERAATLQERQDRARLEGEKLDLRVTQLSAPGRVRVLAEENLQMREPGSEQLEIYGKDGEDGKQNKQEGSLEGSR